jgi:hypothetical protein
MSRFLEFAEQEQRQQITTTRNTPQEPRDSTRKLILHEDGVY